MTQAYSIGAVVGTALAGLVISNLLHDRGLDSSVSRCLGGILGGMALLEAVTWLDSWTAVEVSGAMTLLILIIRLGFRQKLRGTSGKRPDQAWAEVTYAVGGTASLAIGGGLVGDRWLAFLPIAFMAWGDNAAGLTRATVWHDNVASIWPSIAMLGVCFASVALFRTFWIGVAGAVVATAVERYRPRILRFCDDNLIIVITSLAVMIVLSRGP